MELAEVIVMPLFFLAIGWTVKIVLNHRRVLKLSALQAEMQEKTMEKLGGEGEVLEFLRSDLGFKFTDVAPAERKYPYAKILGSIQIGIVLLLAGPALLLLRGSVAGAFEAFSFLGVLGIALGVGFLLSSAISWRLSKSWGLVNGNEDRG